MSEKHFNYDHKIHTYQCIGNWTILHLASLTEEWDSMPMPKNKAVVIQANDLEQFDSAGALALIKCIEQLKAAKNQVQLIGFNSHQTELLEIINHQADVLNYVPPKSEKREILYQIGEETVHKLTQANGLLSMIGDLTDKLLGAFGNWHRFQIPSIISNMSSTGVYALPILALLSFLIGVVLAYQMGLQLETYGATIFIAYLSGMAIFREFAPLITAIIVAGRTSSAFTAQLGSMKINEEIDALYTMGLSPVELLVLPKLIGLLLMFPLLIFWSDFFSTLGAMIMAKFMLHVGYYDFLTRLQDSVGFKQLMLGLYKAPTFAILVALVGCFQGFQVQPNADSVGSQTTRSVVQALFLIIIADAVYSVIYSWLNL